MAGRGLGWPARAHSLVDIGRIMRRRVNDRRVAVAAAWAPALWPLGGELHAAASRFAARRRPTAANMRVRRPCVAAGPGCRVRSPGGHAGPSCSDARDASVVARWRGARCSLGRAWKGAEIQPRSSAVAGIGLDGAFHRCHSRSPLTRRTRPRSLITAAVRPPCSWPPACAG